MTAGSAHRHGTTRRASDSVSRTPRRGPGPPPLVVTIGDPTGIGPELVVRALAAGLLPRSAVLCGHRHWLERAANQVGLPLKLADGQLLEPDIPSHAGRGECQVAYLELAVQRVLAQRGALVTAPISKAAARTAGFTFPGHTEFLAARAGVSDVAMLMVGPELRVVLATTHVSLARLPAALTQHAVARAIRLGTQCMVRDFGLQEPRIAVCGLNPHAGESGLFGREEETIIRPAMEAAARQLDALGIPGHLTGPIPADTAFWQARRGQYDLVVAMYHDQGLAPAKTLDFHHTVNVTLGLPFVRTSPDHGTAHDLVGTGRARLDSFAAALALAVHMWRRRQEREPTGGEGREGLTHPDEARVPSS